MTRHRTAASLFVAQPERLPTAQNVKVSDKVSDSKPNLYDKRAAKSSKPTEEQMGSSGLFKSFGAAAVIQGVDEATPRFVLDPAQKATLSTTLRTQEPWKLKSTPGFRLKRYPLHSSAEEFLGVQQLDPIFIKPAEVAAAHASGSDPLVISKAGENMDRQLARVQESLQSGLVAACSMQQGLGKLKQLISENGDPAIVNALLGDIFESSQDVIDQMGRASAIQHYGRRLQALKTANVQTTEFQHPMLRLPLAGTWLFGEGVRDVTEKHSAQKAVAKVISSSKPKQPHQPFSKKGGVKFSHDQKQQGGAMKRKSFHGQNDKNQGQNQPFRSKFPKRSHQGGLGQNK
jgi:hypothetical protein